MGKLDGLADPSHWVVEGRGPVCQLSGRRLGVMLEGNQGSQQSSLANSLDAAVQEHSS